MSDYKETQKAIFVDKTLDLLEELPEFCGAFYDKKQLRLAPKTQYDYATKMKMFLHFLKENYEQLDGIAIRDITPTDLKWVDSQIVANFITYIRSRTARSNSIAKNKVSTADNYIACVSAYFSFLVKQKQLTENPFLGIDREKKKQKKIVYIEEKDQGNFLNTVTTGHGLSNRKKMFYDKTQMRDICMVQLLMDTGIRLSELVGLDITDVDLDGYALHVQRKSDKAGTVYFSGETKEILEAYLITREDFEPNPNEKALFLSSVGKNRGYRISGRTIERRVKEFALAAGIPNAAQITPHRLRSTYAMDMLRYTGSLALVQAQLGHEHISTTQIYAQSEETKKYEAREVRSKNIPHNSL